MGNSMSGNKRMSRLLCGSGVLKAPPQMCWTSETSSGNKNLSGWLKEEPVTDPDLESTRWTDYSPTAPIVSR